MEKFWLKLRRRSVRELNTRWEHRFGVRSRTVPLAMLIGAAAAAAAALLHELVFMLERFSARVGSDDSPAATALCLALPMVGIILSFTAQRLFGGARYAKSLSPLILALNRRRTAIPGREIFSHIVSSALSVGFGGSAGLEAPSVLTGAAIGANTAGFFGSDRRQKLLLIGCGAAAAISAIFQSPVGGVLFAIEVLLPEFSVAALIPMLISSATAMVISRALFPHPQILLVTSPQWRLDAIPFYFLCGILCALVGVFVIRSAYRITALLKRSLPSSGRRLIAGGIILCALLGVFPVLRGQGYFFITRLFCGDLGTLLASCPLPGRLPPPAAAALVIAAAILLKAAVSAVTVESGGDGGIFAPSMFVGAFTGFAFARLINLSGTVELQEANFVVIGMCGVFSAVLRAPLTGIFLIAEVTSGYTLFVPLMIVSSVAHAVARFFEPHSIYRKALAEANLLADDRDRAMLQTISVRVCVVPEFTPLSPDLNMARLRDIIGDSGGAELFPVLNDKRELAGTVRLEQITPVLFDPQFAETMLVFDLMEPVRKILNEDDDLAEAMNALERTGMDTLPVRHRDGTFMGFVSGVDIFKLYRGIVREADSY